MRTHITSVGLVIARDQSASFEYPTHIDRASLDVLPSKPGVYIFRDENGYPLYIGKSINIRSRVLSHLRTPEEARMLQQTSRIDFERTAGEVGALLLESRLIKKMQPVYNVLLRSTHGMCSLKLADGCGQPPEVVFARNSDFARTEGLYGLFVTRRAAVDTLRKVVEENKLCPALTGLEKTYRGRACFARQISRCLGACVGEETAEMHQSRLRGSLERLKVWMWPWQGPMGIIEESDGWVQTHVVDHWVYLGSIDHSKKGGRVRRPAKLAFDADTYKILVKPMMLGSIRIEPVEL